MVLVLERCLHLPQGEPLEYLVCHVPGLQHVAPAVELVLSMWCKSLEVSLSSET